MFQVRSPDLLNAEVKRSGTLCPFDGLEVADASVFVFVKEFKDRAEASRRAEP